MEVLTLIGKRLKELRDTLDLSLEAFGERISMTKGAISNIEKGTRAFNDRTIKLICQEFNVSELWLRTGEGEMFRNEEDFIKMVSSSIDELEEFDKKIIVEYLKLSPEQRKVIKDFIKKMV
jgi:transcriptional regulator with XRE-family HTH domain